MKVVTTTKARAQLSKILNEVCYGKTPIGIGRRNKIEAVIVKYPDITNDGVGAMTGLNVYGGSFDFLENEPDLYSQDDVKRM